MKSSVLKRALCFICCLSLTLGAAVYEPTKAEAVFVSPAVALGASLLASVVVGTTATFFVESGAADTIGMAIDGLVREFVSTTADLAEYTSDMFFEEIPNGLVLLQDGTIQLSAAAGNLTARFINWLQGENLEGTQTSTYGGGSVLTFDATPYMSHRSVALAPPYRTAVNSNRYSSYGMEDAGIVLSPSSQIYIKASSVSGAPLQVAFWFLFESAVDKIYSSNLSDDARTLNKSTDLYDTGWLSPGTAVTVPEGTCDVWLNCRYADNSDFDDNHAISSFEIYTVQNPTVISYEFEPHENLQTIPQTIPDGEYLTVNPGIQALDFSDPQSAADDIMDAIYAGTLDPSIAIGQEVVDTPEEGTDEDDIITVPGTDADLLDWTKYIGQKVASIPQAIGQSVAQSVSAAFAPDPILVNEITGAFSSKFGFVGTLKQVGDDLFAMDAGTEPPVVWIHLEDAEGRYNYGGAVKALDMSWYQRYKPDVDRIFGGFLWIAYLWLLFKRLPDIINGAGMAVADSLYVGEFEMISGEKIAARRSKRL